MIKDWAIKGMRAEVERINISDMEIVRAKVCKDKEDERLFDSIYKREKGKSIAAQLRNAFDSFYGPGTYYFTPKDMNAFAELSKKLIFTLNGEADRQKVLDLFLALLQSIRDPFIKKNFNPSMINSRYNELINEARRRYAPKDYRPLFGATSGN